MQKTHQSALQVQQKAEALLQANHYDMDMIRECAEKVLLFCYFMLEIMDNNRRRKVADGFNGKLCLT